MSIKPLSPADDYLDRIVLATWINPGTQAKPTLREEMIPEQHLRTAIGFLSLAGIDPTEPFKLTPVERFALFSPRKTSTTERHWDSNQANTSLDWLLTYKILESLGGYTYRFSTQSLPAPVEPEWEYARNVARAAVELRLQPAQVAILARSAYHADEHGEVLSDTGSALTMRILADITGFDQTRTLSGYKNGRPGHVATLASLGERVGIKDVIVAPAQLRRPTALRLVLCRPTGAPGLAVRKVVRPTEEPKPAPKDPRFPSKSALRPPGGPQEGLPAQRSSQFPQLGPASPYEDRSPGSGRLPAPAPIYLPIGADAGAFHRGPDPETLVALARRATTVTRRRPAALPGDPANSTPSTAAASLAPSPAAPELASTKESVSRPKENLETTQEQTIPLFSITLGQPSKAPDDSVPRGLAFTGV
jgi:hypothetical protein